MVFEKVVQMISEIVESDSSELKMETALGELGLDSLDITEIIMNLESEFSIEIEISDEIKTIGNLVNTIESLIK